MDKLIHAIQSIRQKLPTLRKQGLKETPTRTIIIDPLLEALGWDVRDPSEVEMEYPTVDGRSVDYALKLNEQPVLLIEAKALGDSLEDVKAITQVVGYAANNGIDWCILTNGVLWRVYRSVEKCPAPEKLMFDVDIDRQGTDAPSVERIAREMWQFSREELARGTLDDMGERIFTDGKVRKALESLMLAPPIKFLKLLRETVGDDKLSHPRIKESLGRLRGLFTTSAAPQRPPSPLPESGEPPGAKPPPAVRRTPKGRPKKGESTADEARHLEGKPSEVVAIYRKLEQFCLNLEPGTVDIRYLVKSVNFDYAGRCFCSVHLEKSKVMIWIVLRYKEIKGPPPFAHDVSQVSHWGVGDTELRITKPAELDAATALIRQSFLAVKNKLAGKPRAFPRSSHNQET
jgi:predicted transport protein